MLDDEFAKMLGNIEELEEDGEARRLDEDWRKEGRHLQVAGEVNWADTNLTPVKDQGQCGSCVAFATSTITEGLISIKTGNDPVRLSEQHLVDCASINATNFETNYGNYGCSGGWIYKYLNFIIGEGVCPSEAYGAYTATDGTCLHDPEGVVAQGATRGYITTNVADIITKLNEGPMPISISAGNSAFRYYKGGIM